MVKRLIAVGRKQAKFQTQTWQYAVSETAWSPTPAPDDEEPDHDLIRKQRLEGQEEL